MAYAESTIGGSSGNSFRVWVNSIRTYDGGPAENVEDWRVEGGINRVSTAGGRIYNNYNNSTYTVQLGMNGVATSGSFSYDSTGTGGLKAWGTGATRVGRNAAGVGFGFTSRTDVNMSNGPYLTSGWVQSSDSVQTRYRHAVLTALSMDVGNIPGTDEGPIWLEFSNPGGASVDAFIETAPSFPRAYTSPGGQGSRYNFPNLAGGSLTVALQQASPNSNTNTMRIGIHDSQGGDNWDYRDRTYTIKNDIGQANPTFSNFTYLDTNATSVAVTGSNQVLIQGKSTLEATVSVANKATAKKFATMSSYLFTIGAYSNSSTWSNTVDVVKTIGTVSDVFGAQTLSVGAIDSRGNSTTVTKNVTVLEYASPGFYNNLDVGYTNDFDSSSGLTVNLFNTSVIGSISPMVLAGTDKNAVTAVTGIQFDIAKGAGAYTGVWTNVAFTQQTGTGVITVTPATLATQILSKMNTMIADNTVQWFVMFKIQDKLETQYYTAVVDVGRPFFRIGANGRLYYKEIEFFETFSGDSSIYFPALLAGSITGTWALETPPAARVGGFSMYRNTSQVINDECYIDTYVPAGTYSVSFLFDQATTGGRVALDLDRQIVFSSSYETAGTAGTNTGSTGNVNFLDGATYRMYIKVTGNGVAPATPSCRLLGIRFNRIGFTP